MKKILTAVWNFFFENFGVKIALVGFACFLSFLNWEGWPFMLPLAMVVVLIISKFVEKPKI
jgi:hypothetical protein